MSWSVVIPTVGRPSLTDLLTDLSQQTFRPGTVIVVDDRRTPVSASRRQAAFSRRQGPFPLRRASFFLRRLPFPLKRREGASDGGFPVSAIDTSAYSGAVVLSGGGRGPAAARNVGWRATDSEWVVFLDDDVRLPPDWSEELAKDLETAETVAGVQGGIVVPGPLRTDWERSTGGLQNAWWATADMAYRRRALQQVGGFDERFPRAYREDAELALRVRQHGWGLTRGTRHIIHPVRGENFWVSVRVQRGNADDSLMRGLHGPNWRLLASCPPGRLRWHIPTVIAGAGALAGLTAFAQRRLISPGHRQPLSGNTPISLAGKAGAVAWLALTADLAWRRIAPGPRTRDEITKMAVTSVVIPPVAVWHRLRGWWRWRRRETTPWPGPVEAVLFDRDGTLVHDVPYNGDPEKVEAVPGARQAVARLRAAGVKVGVVTNQSAVGRGMVTPEEVALVNKVVDELVGPFDTWQVCPHTDADGCECRKPAGGLVTAAAEALSVSPRQIVVIGDIGSDMLAADAAGARSVLVPNGATRADEVAAAPVVQPDLRHAVEYVLALNRWRR